MLSELRFLVSLDLAFPFQPPVNPNPFLLVPQLPHHHAESVRCQLQSFVSCWGIGYIIGESVEIRPQLVDGDVLRCTDPGQRYSVLESTIRNKGVELIDTIQRCTIVDLGS